MGSELTISAMARPTSMVMLATSTQPQTCAASRNCQGRFTQAGELVAGGVTQRGSPQWARRHCHRRSEVRL